MLRRVQAADGRTRAFVNDQPATAQALRAIGRELVEIHCQHDERALVDPNAHRALVDAHGGLVAQANDVRARYGAWQAARRALAEEDARIAKARADADYLRHAHAELSELAPQEGEEETLAERRLFMQRAEKVASDISDALSAFSNDAIAGAGNRSGGAAIGAASDAGAATAGRACARLDAALSTRWASPRTRWSGRSLRRNSIRRNWSGSRSGCSRCAAPRASIRSPSPTLRSLKKNSPMTSPRSMRPKRGSSRWGARLQTPSSPMTRAALALSAARRAAAKKLDALVDAELKPLRLEGAHFSTQVTSDAESAGPEGIDRVEFWVQTNPGSRPGPLTKVASGGELARFMLALKVVLADRGSAPTLVFDEIDTGVGGAVADAIGQRLARLAARAQVLAVTHAPQVAARAGQHLRISKGAPAKSRQGQAGRDQRRRAGRGRAARGDRPHAVGRRHHRGGARRRGAAAGRGGGVGGRFWRGVVRFHFRHWREAETFGWRAGRRVCAIIRQGRTAFRATRSARSASKV